MLKARNSGVCSVSLQKGNRTKGFKNELYTCPVCEDQIMDSSNACKGQDAVFCEGNCSTCLH